MTSFLRDRHGDMIVEFGLSSLVFFITIFGILEFGQAVWRYNVVADLAKQGARRAAVCGSNSGYAASRATECNIQTFVQGRSTSLSICNTCVTVTPSDLSTAAAGTVVEVRVQNSFTPLTGIIPRSALTFSSTSQMIVAR